VVAPLRPHPDLVSLVAFIVALAGAAAMATGEGVVGGILVQLASILDGTDGELARLQVRTSPAGALLDGAFDRLGDAAVIAAMAVWGIDQGRDPELVAVVAIAAATGAMLSMAIKDRIAALGIPPLPERALGWLLGGRDARLLILAIAAAAGLPLVGLVAVAVTSAVSLVVRVLMARMAVHVVDSLAARR
jgi:phosphatidylglycerophosphate synthase